MQPVNLEAIDHAINGKDQINTGDGLSPGRRSGDITPSPPRTPGRMSTDPSHVRVVKSNKRLIICCDGTWQDALTVTQNWKYTNVLRLSRAVKHVDERQTPPMPQIVYYQSGVGTDGFAGISILDGAVGATLGDKVQEAYGFLAQNYLPGDEIFLFGFSRGAYTARMIAAFIGEIGILDRKDMDHFADIFIWLQKRGKTKDEKEKKELDEKLQPWTHRYSPGRLHAISEDNGFSIKCVGVFDTVGSVGLPEEVRFSSKKIENLFGFPDKSLGPHIARAYHALALNEMRKDFDCTKFYQTEAGKEKGQVLKQIGGGYEEHDLSDLSLFWMAAHVGDILALDMTYLASLVDPVAEWGTQSPHDSQVGIFSLASTINRTLPTQTGGETHEYIHASVLQQSKQNPTLQEDIKNNPLLVPALLPLEEEIKALWKPSSQRNAAYQERKSSQDEGLLTGETKDIGIMCAEPEVDQNRLMKGSSIGKFLKELLA
ncbi:hypothetical protein QCA50_001915 [Cerrena zonata]|uniref:T6SS Phospholipase effector Tle1-like catalytic domain-containing protein n=1 Tax=Cerrena zonata TaxID=2478898 RepID=A0AAW0GS34_9APHY